MSEEVQESYGLINKQDKCLNCGSINIGFWVCTFARHGDNADRVQKAKHCYCYDCDNEWYEKFNKESGARDEPARD
jgi:hypothetical protein